ncbi:MAG: Ig-like domain-containing protein [Anaerolineales bacterium]|jgi:hypothetical protein|nr:Ig-like domain-containing protein [Anaerolineales bacterium]
MKIRIGLIAILILIVLGFSYSNSWAQEEELTLSWSRDFGYASGGGDIQGVFSLTAKGPANIAKVEFYIDDTLIGSVTSPPFKLQFTTDNHSLGVHTIYATATLDDGSELRTRDYKRNFVAAGEGMQAALKILLPLLGLVFGILLISYVGPLLLNRGKRKFVPFGTPRNYGVMGGTICPRCQRPFALHLMSINISFTGRLDFCPHCGKWSIVHRKPLAELRQAEQAEVAESTEENQIKGLSEEEKLRKELDNSRYQGF